MSTLLIKRAHRALLFSMVALLTASLLAPMAAVANTDLVIGDTAIVNNPAGAYLRSDITVVDDSTISAELPDGATVYVQDGPFFTDTGVWVWVSSDGFGPGYISTDLLQKIGSEELAEANGVVAEEPVAEEPVVSELAWLEPIDSLVVVDYNAALPTEGLAVYSSASLDAPILGYAPVGSGLDVTSSREWVGDISFVRVNWGGSGAYVDGRYVELASEAAVVEEPTEEVIWIDDPVTEEPVVDEPVTEEPVVEEPVTEEPVVEEPVTEEPVVEEPVTEEPVVEEPVTEEPVVEEPVTEEPVVEEPVTEEPVVEEPVTEEPVVEEPVTEEPVVEDPATEEAATEEVVTEPVVDETATEEVATEEVVTEPVVDETATEEVVAETEVPDTQPAVVPTETPVTPDPVAPTATTAPATEAATVAPATEVPATVTATVAPATEVPATKAPATVTATVAPATEAPATEAPAETVAPTATVAPTEAPVAPQPIASTALSFNADAMIGSATVTGTNNGLLCRVDPNPAAPVLMTLSEGTKVLVSAEPVNGYLGIDCGGLQGFADVNYLWSGGAGDEEITASKMNVVVTGTGNGLNCRTGAGTNHSVITTIFDGTTLVTRGKATNGWTPVTCGGQNGFVSTTWIEVGSGSNTGAASGSTSTTGTAVVNTGGDGLYCRSGAGTSYGVITVLSHGASVSVRGAQQGDWVPVTCGGSAGFAHSSFLNVSAGSTPGTPDSGTSTPSGTVTVANTGGQGLNCRTGAGTGNSIITTLALGQSVQTRSGSVNGWTAVICGGTNGFVSTEFVSGGTASTPPATSTPDNGNVSGATGKATVNTGGDGLYCRSGAGSSSGVITVMSHGSVVATRGSASNGWVPITCAGQSGWAHSDYLTIGSGSTTAPKPAEPAPAPPALAAGNNAKITEAVSMRYSGSQSASVVTTVEAGVVIKITGSLSNSYYPVDYDGLKGFIHQDYLVKTSAAVSQRGGSGTPDTPAPSNPDSGSTSPTGNAMVNYAMRYVGYPYVWATHGPASFDCSGFTYWVVLNVTGKNIGAGTWTQVSAGTPVSKANLQPGDLVFFQNTYTAGLSHVGLYIGNGQFIHAQNESTGVVVSDLNSSYYGPRWYGAVRI